MKATRSFAQRTICESNQWQPSRRHALIATTTAAPTLLAIGQPQQRAIAAAASPDTTIPTTPVSDSLSISRVIKGCWQLSGGHGGDKSSDRTSGKAAVEDFKAFVDAGVTTFDTADIYGPSEATIGQFLKSADADTRSKVRVMTKFCCFGQSCNAAKSADYVQRSIDNSRGSLGMDTLDCVQFYWHDYNTKNYVAAALHLADLKAKGRINTVGVTNFDTLRLEEMISAGVPIKVNQIQYSLLDTRPENGHADYCLNNGIGIVSYGTVAGGFLSEKYLGKNPREINLNTYSLSKYASVIQQRGGWEWFQRLLQLLKDIGDTHGVGIAEVSSRWVLQKPAVAGVIVGARNANHVEQHKRLFGFELNADDLALIDGILQQGQQPTSDVYSWERGGKWA